jgi:RHS repeat-associated protein
VRSITPTCGGTAIRTGYDSVGKVTSGGLTQDSITVYTPFQSPLTVSQAGGDTVTTQYDADHNRVYRSVSNAGQTLYQTWYFFDSEKKQTTKTVFWNSYFMVEGGRIGEEDKPGGLAHQYFLNDLQNIGYDAFGKPRYVNGSADPSCGTNQTAVTTRGYINQVMMNDLCLVDLNARYYDPALFKFLAPDPVIADPDDSQAWNAYAYSHNNPRSKSDPTGLEDITVHAPGDPFSGPQSAHGASVRPDASAQFIHPGPQLAGLILRAAKNGSNSSASRTLASINPMVQVTDSSGNTTGYATAYDIAASVASFFGQRQCLATCHGYTFDPSRVEVTPQNHPLLFLGAALIPLIVEPELAPLRAGGLGLGAAEEAGVATTTVGRYMSQAELDAMTTSGRVQESFNNGVTSVTVPPNPGLYRAAPTSDIFTQFDVPTSSLNGVGTGTAKIYGPNSIFGPRLGITEMPPATNIVVPR